MTPVSTNVTDGSFPFMANSTGFPLQSNPGSEVEVRSRAGGRRWFHQLPLGEDAICDMVNSRLK